MRPPQRMVRARDAVKAGALWDELYPVCEFICAKSHVRVAHTGLEIAGRPVGPPRSPIRPLDSQDRARLTDILTSLTHNQVGSQAA